MYRDPHWLLTAGRLLIVASFLAAGIRNMTAARIADHINRMVAAKTPMAREAFWLGIVMQFTGCALLLFDWYPAVGAWLLIVFTVAATVIFHRFWQKPDPMVRNIATIMLLNNVATLGGLLLLAYYVG
ncbi:MAG TPA: DoxX family protein [Alphaproteobacteria bacterium]